MTEIRPTDGDDAALVATLSALAAERLVDLEAELVEIVLKGPRNRRIVRVVVDADEGVDVDAIAAVSRRMSEVLDEDEELIPGAYTLEVTSPGVDRPLTEVRHWKRNVGRNVHVVHDKRGQVKETEGKLASVDDQQVVINVKGRMVTIALDAVERAKVVLPW